MNPYRKLLISAINELLDRGLISLTVNESTNRSEEQGHILLDLLGYPTAISWNNIGFQELRISVWWKYDHSLHPQANLTGSSRESFRTSFPLAKRQHFKKFVGVTVSGYLERKEGKFLQGKDNRGILDIYTRTGEKIELENAPSPKPNGYAAEGLVL
jgi:hypothetical protein